LDILKMDVETNCGEPCISPDASACSAKWKWFVSLNEKQMNLISSGRLLMFRDATEDEGRVSVLVAGFTGRGVATLCC
jgi:hypothetical protein